MGVQRRMKQDGDGACFCKARKGGSKVCAVLLLTGLFCVVALALATPVSAQTTNLTVEQKYWNITGLDSNKPLTEGTNYTTIHLRICNNGSENATNVMAIFSWNDTNEQYIYLHPNEIKNKTLGTIAPDDCKDVFWVVFINRSTPIPPPGDPIIRTFSVNVTANNSNSTIITDTFVLKKLISQAQNEITFHYYYPELITVCTNFTVFCNITITNKDEITFIPIAFDPAIVELVNVSFTNSTGSYDTFYFPSGLAEKNTNITYTFHAIAPGTTAIMPMLQELRGGSYKYAAGIGFPNITVCSDNGSLNLTKTANKTENLMLGETVMYTLNVTNTGDMPLSNVTVYDSLTGNHSVGTLNISETKTVYTNQIITVEDICRGWVYNSAYATGKDPCNTTITSNTTYVNVTTSYDASFTVMKLAEPAANVTVGQTINYTIWVNNTGDVNLTNVTVVDPLLNHSWVIPVLVPNGSWNYSVSYTVTEANACRGWINNSLAVNATDPCYNTLETQYTYANVSVYYISALNVTKIPNSYGPFYPGQNVTYNITVCNIGNLTLSNVTLNDAILNLTDYELVILAPGACNWTEFNYTITEGDACTGWINNTVNVSATDYCNDTIYNESYENVTTTYVSALNVTKVAEGEGPYHPGDTITYNISVCNIGNTTLTNVTMNDPKLGLVNVNIGTLAPGACNWTEFNYTITEGDACTGWINNTVNVSATDYCNDTIYNESYENVTTTYVSALNVTKVAEGEGPYHPGDTITYNISVCNTGNVTVENVTMNDAILNLTDYVLVMTLSPATCSSIELNYTVNVTDCSTGWVNNTVYVNGTDYCGKDVTMVSASQNVSIECGYCISGYKLNETGSGLAGWTINVTNSTGVEVGSNVTNETGYWQVCGLPAGTYTVCETLQAGWIALDPETSCNDSVTLTNADVTNVNFTNRRSEELYCISGYKLNEIGSGLAGWTINVTNSTGVEVGSNVTNETGYWQVCGLPPGEYTACEVPLPWWQIVNPESGCQNVSFDTVNITGITFINSECNGSIGEFVWLDVNQNGIQDVNEPGIAGVKVILYRHDGGNVTLVNTTITDVNGFYRFEKLCAGNYSLQFIPPQGFAFTFKNLGNPHEDSDADPATGRTDIFYLSEGEHNRTIDAGLYQFEQAPALTPSGLIALVGLLASIAALSVRRKKR